MHHDGMKQGFDIDHLAEIKQLVNIPIIASVSEHQPTAWSSFYFDLQLLLFLFPVGLYHCFKHLTDINIFIVLYGLTSIYFAVSVMLFLIF